MNTTEFAFCPANILVGTGLDSLLWGKLTRRFDYDTGDAYWRHDVSNGDVSSVTALKIIQSGLEII